MFVFLCIIHQNIFPPVAKGGGDLPFGGPVAKGGPKAVGVYSKFASGSCAALRRKREKTLHIMHHIREGNPDQERS